MSPKPAPIPAGWHAPAEQQWRGGDRVGAIQAAVQALNALAPAKPAPRLLQIGYYLFLINDFNGAGTVLEQLLQHEPAHAEALVNLAVCRQRQGRHAEVLALTDRVLAGQPELPLALDLRAKSLFSLGREAEAADAGTRALQAKDRALPAPATPWAPPDGRSAAQQAAGKPGVIAFSLWGAHPRYLRGTLRNALLLPELYPGWVMRLYADETVPAPFLEALRGLGVDVRLQPPGQSLRQRLCWRFQVANDASVGRFLVRDCDAVFSLREVQSVQDWIASGQWFHVLRDWWTHTDLVLAGLWGGVAGVLPDLSAQLAGYDSGRAETPNIDQWFLRDRVWPLLRGHILVHDRLFRMAGSVGLPAPTDRRHIGQDEFAAHRQAQQAWLSAWIAQLPCLALPA
jgi:hypothetical protein